MDNDNFENNYDKIKEDLKATWKVLTDQDLESLKGRKDKLVSFIEKCYGQKKETIEERINSFINKDREPNTQE